MISDGVATEDQSSDWNAPNEQWDNFEEPKIDPHALKEMPVNKPLVVWQNTFTYYLVTYINKNFCRIKYLLWM